MKRRVFRILSGLSLGLCVAAALASLRYLLGITVMGGAMCIDRGSLFLGTAASKHFRFDLEFSQKVPAKGFGGFYYLSIPRGMNLIGIPLWLLSVICLVLFVRSLRKATQDLDESPRCIACGYDLRATPDRCPECGVKTRGIALSDAADHDKPQINGRVEN